MHDAKLTFCDDELNSTLHLLQAAADGQFDTIGHGESSPGEHCIGIGMGVSEKERPVMVPALTLSTDQNRILARILGGESIFFTGSAGTGKSVLLRGIIESLKELGKEVAVTASTGIAAINIGGTTLHSFAGMGLAKEPVEELAEKLKRSQRLTKKWKEIDVLIIDEISMTPFSLSDTQETLARVARHTDAPFGGIQLVLSGDFCQLPPVPEVHNGLQQPISFAFEARSWDRCVTASMILRKVFRQKDYFFVQLLNHLRLGSLDALHVKEMIALSRPLIYDDGIEPTELYPLRREAEDANSMRLANLPPPTHEYISFDEAGYVNGNRVSAQRMQKLLEQIIAVKMISLKVGAQVMLIKNLSQGLLVNGSLGQVIAFQAIGQAASGGVSSGDDATCRTHNVASTAMYQTPQLWPLVRFTNGHELLCVPEEFRVENRKGEIEARRFQVPLILAWAMTVHKSQGQTIERLKVDLGRTFEKGQVYVALSRATSMDGVQLVNFDCSIVMTHPRVLQWHEDLSRRFDDEEVADISRELLENEGALEAFFSYEDDDLDSPMP